MSAMKALPPQELLTAKQVASQLRCSVSLVYALAKKGTLASVKIGGIVRFLRSDLDDAIANNRVSGVSED